jgi:hypothetical protein
MIKLVEDLTHVPARIQQARARLRAMPMVERHGRVIQMIGLVIESQGPMSAIGDICRIESSSNPDGVLAEVVGPHGYSPWEPSRCDGRASARADRSGIEGPSD